MNRTVSSLERRSAVLLLAASSLLFLSIGSVLQAQDAGTPDTCKYVPATSVWNVIKNGDSLFYVPLWAYSDASNIIGATLGFKLKTSTGHGHGHDDSLIVVDTFRFSPDTDPVLFRVFSRSLVYKSYDPTAMDWGYNGYAAGLLSSGAAIFPPNTPMKIGDVRLKILDRSQLPDSFDIEIDSSWFPPAGPFKYSPGGGAAGFPPKFIKSVVTVKQLVCGDVTSDDFVDIDDIVFLINYIFGGGPEPVPYEIGNANCSEPPTDIDDVVYLIQFVFGGGPVPCYGC